MVLNSKQLLNVLLYSAAALAALMIDHGLAALLLLDKGNFQESYFQISHTQYYLAFLCSLAVGVSVCYSSYDLLLHLFFFQTMHNHWRINF